MLTRPKKIEVHQMTMRPVGGDSLDQQHLFTNMKREQLHDLPNF
jgi:hypothetical protein